MLFIVTVSITTIVPDRQIFLSMLRWVKEGRGEGLRSFISKTIGCGIKIKFFAPSLQSIHAHFNSTTKIPCLKSFLFNITLSVIKAVAIIQKFLLKHCFINNNVSTTAIISNLENVLPYWNWWKVTEGV